MLDEVALIAYMAYVDLNPIRAAMDETSDYTSIQQLINEVNVSAPVHTEDLAAVIPKLMGFSGKQAYDESLPCVSYWVLLLPRD